MMLEFQQEYIAEAKQVLINFEHSVLMLEKNPSQEELNNAYRHLHTLKGSAGMFGFSEIERLTHALEDRYSEIRDGVCSFDSDILDLSLNSVDVLRDLLDHKDVTDKVDHILHSLSVNSTPSASQLTGSRLTTDEKSGQYAIVLYPDKDIFQRGINLAGILSELQELGAVEVIVHNEQIPFEQQLATKQLSSWLEILLLGPKTVDAITDVFLFLRPNEYRISILDNSADFPCDIYKDLVTLTPEEVANRKATLTRLQTGKLVLENKPTSTPDVQTKVEPVRSAPLNERKHKEGSQLTVSSEKLDNLIDIVSELVIFRTELTHLMGETENPVLIEALEKLERLTLGLRDSAFNIRLVPLTTLNVKLQRLIRTLTQELNKDINFITEGLDTELDRGMISALEGPLMHLIRNAVDHGIESPAERLKANKPEKGLVKLFSYNSGDHVFIQVQDDGRGLDFDKIRAKGIEKGLISTNQQCSERELINLMMSPGFSTADTVTTISGRGVGMDVVKRDIAALRGEIEVSTEKGLGSIFTIRLPLTLTILDTLVVTVDEHKYLIPINEIEHCFKEKDEVLFGKKSRHIQYDGLLVPFVSLREFFGLDISNGEHTVIVIHKNDTRIAVVVDDIAGKLQTVFKPLNKLLGMDCFSGSSILGDGSMALIIDALKLKN